MMTFTNLTGHPVLDTILVSFAVTLTPYLYKQINTWVEEVVARFESGVCIPDVELIRACTSVNPKYEAVLAWLNDHVAYKHGSIEVTAKRLRPKTTSHQFTYNGSQRLRFWCTEEECKARFHTTTVNTLHITGKRLQDVLAFVEEVYEDHLKASRARKKWMMVDGVWTSEPLPVRTFEQLALDASVKEDLVNDLETFLASEAQYRRVGVMWKRGYLLHGPPGSGKSSTILAMAQKSLRDVYVVSLNELEDDTGLHACLSQVPTEAVVVFEDIDCDGRLAHERQAPKEEPVVRIKNVTLKALLNELDGLNSTEGRIAVVTTNHRDLLDSALIRPGRIDKQVLLGNATTATVAGLMSLFFGRAPNPAIEVKKTVTPALVSGICLENWSDFDAAVRKVRRVV